MGPDGSFVSAGYSNGTIEDNVDRDTYWTAVKLDADGAVLWQWKNETRAYVDANDRITGAAVGQDGSVVLAGDFGDDFQVIKLDADGSFVWHFEGGTNESDSTHGIAMGDDGSVVVGVAVLGSWDIPNVGGRDMAAFKLDANGTLLWKWQDGTTLFDNVEDVAMAEDGSVVIVGSSSGDFTSTDAGLSDSSTSMAMWTQSNFSAIKLDSEGSEVWRWQDGVSGGFDRLNSVSVTENGSYIMAGYTPSVWSGAANEGGTDFAAVKLDADGIEVWRWQDGTVKNDVLEAVVVQVDGTIVLGGYTGGDWNGSSAGGYDFALVGLDVDGEESWRWQGGSVLSDDLSVNDYLYAMATGSGGRVVLVGQTNGDWEETNLGQGDYLALMLDTGALATPSPTVAPSPAALVDPSPTPATVVSPSVAPALPPALTPAPNASPATAVTFTPAPNSAPSQASKTVNSPAPSPATSSTQIPSTPQPLATLDPSPSPTLLVYSTPTPAAANSTSIVAGVASAVGGVALIALGLYVRKRHIEKRNCTAQQVHPPVVEGDGGNVPRPLPHNFPPSPRPSSTALEAASTVSVGLDGGVAWQFPAKLAGAVIPGAERTWHAGKAGECGGRVALAVKDDEQTTHADKEFGRGGGGGGVANEEGDDGDISGEAAVYVTTSTAQSSTGGKQEEMPQSARRVGLEVEMLTADEAMPISDETGASSSPRRRGSSGGLGLGQVVRDAALELAHICQIPGVSEAATAVSVLVNLVMDNRDNKKGTEASLKRCRSIVLMLERAAKVLGKGGETTGKAERVMMEDVHDAIFDLVELVKTYQSKNRLSQLLMSTLFRRRQDEMGAVVERAILSLQLGLHVQVGTDVKAVKQDVSAVRQDVSAFKEGMQLCKGSIEEAQSKSLADARKARRQRKLNQIEIAEDHLIVTDELLGKGGFGEVYLADYNGRNAAAKVLHIDRNSGILGENNVLDGSTGDQAENQREKSQRKAFLRELDAMIRLRSPYTVNVYGAVTSMQDRLVLVLELLAGGDLRTLLKHSKQPLPEQQSRQIIRDICTGMAFLHSKQAVHGDLKSGNVLLDGAGRAKIGDFGTSRWTQHTKSTGLATFTTKSGKGTQLSLAWSAPEVLDAARSTYASDVYSFGVVVWEVLSRELPWATVMHPRDIYISVALKGLRPAIPDDAPARIANVARASWVGEPGERPMFSDILKDMKSDDWNE